MTKEERIEFLREFASKVSEWKTSKSEEARTFINENKQQAKRFVAEAGVYKTLTIAPPPAIGGLVYRDADLFDLLFNPPYGAPISRTLLDMLQEAVGVIRSGSEVSAPASMRPVVSAQITEGYVFIAMPMASDDPALVDVLDAIKEAASRCGLHAQRVDDEESNERITDRILESIDRAQFVVADLTHSRPNVFFEAGYAHASGKIPIYVAREGTRLEFDLKDYPVIFFSNMKTLKDGLEKRLRSIASPKSGRS